MLRSKRSGRTTQPAQRGFTLMDVIAALCMMAMLAAVSINRFRSAAADTVANATTAQSLTLDLARIRRLAIQSGEPHGVRFVAKRGEIQSYTPFRKDDRGREVMLAGQRSFPVGTVCRSRSSRITFQPDGTCTRSHTIELKAPARTWQVTVVPVTGSCLIQEQ